jgi:hypothetical protein
MRVQDYIIYKRKWMSVFVVSDTLIIIKDPVIYIYCRNPVVCIVLDTKQLVC